MRLGLGYDRVRLVDRPWKDLRSPLGLTYVRADL